MSSVFKKLMKLHGIAKLHTPAYHPQGNGIAEAFMKVLGNSLTTLVGKRHGDWDKYCEQIALAYRATPHPSTGETPFYLMHGRDLRLPVDTALESLEKQVVGLTRQESSLKTHLQCLKVAQDEARDALQKMHDIASHRYNRGRKDVKYKVGDLVHVKLSFHDLQDFPSSKLAPKWTGPARVTHVLDNGRTCDVEDIMTGDKRRVNAVRLKPHLAADQGMDPLKLKEITEALSSPPIWQADEVRDRYESAVAPPMQLRADQQEYDDALVPKDVSTWQGPAFGLRNTIARRAMESQKRQERLVQVGA